MKTSVKIGLTIVLLASLAIYDIKGLLAENRCPICTYPARHAPCLLNLKTGEVGSLDVYEYDELNSNVIAEYQRSGFMCLFTAAGLHGIRWTDPWYVQIYIPDEKGCFPFQKYCREHRTLLSEIDSDYVLLDLLDPQSLGVYPLNAESSFAIRCYEILTEWDANREQWKLTINGTLPFG